MSDMNKILCDLVSQYQILYMVFQTIGLIAFCNKRTQNEIESETGKMIA